jgi:hypothetical protein
MFTLQEVFIEQTLDTVNYHLLNTIHPALVYYRELGMKGV